MLNVLLDALEQGLYHLGVLEWLARLKIRARDVDLTDIRLRAHHRLDTFREIMNHTIHTIWVGGVREGHTGVTNHSIGGGRGICRRKHGLSALVGYTGMYAHRLVVWIAMEPWPWIPIARSYRHRAIRGESESGGV